MMAQVEADERHVVAHQPDLLALAEHRFDAGQPGRGLFLFAVGISKGKLDARPYRSALTHLVEQVSHGFAITLAIDKRRGFFVNHDLAGNATGVRVRDYPITLDKLLDRLPPLPA